MAYALQSMLKIRVMREDRAQTELTGARRARAVAEEELEEKKKELAKFEETKEERRDKVYDAVIGRVCSMEDLDKARDAVTKIDEEGMLLEEAKLKAKTNYDKKDEEAEGARVRYVAAMKNLSKIEEHKKAWEEIDRKEQQMREDAEMEEFTGRKMTDDDDDSFD